MSACYSCLAIKISLFRIQRVVYTLSGTGSHQFGIGLFEKVVTLYMLVKLSIFLQVLLTPNRCNLSTSCLNATPFAVNITRVYFELSLHLANPTESLHSRSIHVPLFNTNLLLLNNCYFLPADG